MAGWTSTQGVTNISLNITAPANQYTYTLSGLPGKSTSTGAASQVQASGPVGCSFASAGTGTYARQLCFADFSGFNYTGPGCQNMKLLIENSSDYLQFCVSETGVLGTNPTNASTTDTIRPQIIPTYYLPGAGGFDSEAFLGNNGFYTGIPGQPALSQRPQPNYCNGNCTWSPGDGVFTTITFTNVRVTNAQNQSQSGWTLVSGDAESTDTDGWLHLPGCQRPLVDPSQLSIFAVGQFLLRHSGREQHTCK